jgi:Uma2 family endonuclease
MRALVLEPSKEWLEDRRRRGADRRDEVWDGVLHMVPPASTDHQCFSADLFDALRTVAKPKGLRAWFETGLFRPTEVERNFRVPDLMCVRDTLRTKRGIEGDAEFVVEILSPDDESYEKLPFFESLGVHEVLIVDPVTRACDFYVLRGGKLRLMTPDSSGALRSEALGLALRVVDGPKLRLEWDGGSAEI